MERFQSRGRLVAGVSFDIPGMGYKNPQTGAIEGFEANLARAIEEKLLGAPDRVDLVQVTDEQRIQALQDDLVDMVVSQLTITPDRAEQVDFSVPYYVTREGLLVLAGTSIRRFEDLAGKRIAVTAGSSRFRGCVRHSPHYLAQHWSLRLWVSAIWRQSQRAMRPREMPEANLAILSFDRGARWRMAIQIAQHEAGP